MVIFSLYSSQSIWVFQNWSRVCSFSLRYWTGETWPMEVSGSEGLGGGRGKGGWGVGEREAGGSRSEVR
jgi:hypothetical protein